MEEEEEAAEGKTWWDFFLARKSATKRNKYSQKQMIVKNMKIRKWEVSSRQKRYIADELTYEHRKKNAPVPNNITMMMMLSNNKNDDFFKLLVC